MLNPLREPFCSITNGGITSAATRSSRVSPSAEAAAVLAVCASADAAMAATISATANKRRLFRNARPSVVSAVGVGPEPLHRQQRKRYGPGLMAGCLASSPLRASGIAPVSLLGVGFNPPVESTAPLSPRTP